MGKAQTDKGPSAEGEVRYLVNEAGEQESVVLPTELFEKLIAELEDLEDLRDAEEAFKENEWESLDEVKSRLGL